MSNLCKPYGDGRDSADGHDYADGSGYGGGDGSGSDYADVNDA